MIVDVRVSIDRQGKVVNAESVTPKPVHKLFVNEQSGPTIVEIPAGTTG